MSQISLDTLTKTILSALFQACQSGNGNVAARPYRAKHEEWFSRLRELEHQRLLMLENDFYRLPLWSLTLIDDGDAKCELERCEMVFGALRSHYKDDCTHDTEKKLSELAFELDLDYAQVVKTIRLLLDASPLWSGGHTLNFDDKDSAAVRPGEAIIPTKSFQNLIAITMTWIQPTSPVDFNVASLNSMGSAPATTSMAQGNMHPGPIVTSFLYELGSETVLRIVGRAGLNLDWVLTDAEAYSEKTRLRAYRPRIESALASLDEKQRLLVSQNIAGEILSERPEYEERLNYSLGTIGWKVVEGTLTSGDMDLRERFFPSGSAHSAYVDLKRILMLAHKDVFIVDPYLDGSIFIMLSTMQPRDFGVRLLTNKAPIDFNLEAAKFRQEFSGVQLDIRRSADFHDRFIILDGKSCFHIGASIKDAGNRAFMISQLEEAAIVNTLVSFADDKWKNAATF